MTPTRNTRIAAIAGIAVALVAAGGAYAASKLHNGSGAQRSGFGRFALAPGGFAPGYGLRGRDDGGSPDGFRRGPGDAFATVTSYLGISTQKLFTQLRSGKTLAQIADATSGKSAAGLIDALVAAEQKEHPDASASDIRARVTALVNGTGFGFHRFGGPPPGATPEQSGEGIHI